MTVPVTEPNQVSLEVSLDSDRLLPLSILIGSSDSSLGPGASSSALRRLSLHCPDTY